MDIIRKFALLNAIKHDGKADKGAVIAYIIGEDNSYRTKIKDLMPEVDKVIKEVSKIKVENQIKELEKEHPELLEKREEEVHVLPKLQNAVEGKVVVRIAPYPSGPLHIGNTRQVIVNDEYAKSYKGKFLLILDDTIGSEEKNITKDAYDLIPEGIKWLGVNYEPKIIYKSDRLEIYYKYADEIIEKGKAYACKCSSEEIRENRANGIECKCRKQGKEETKKEWKAMLEGKYKEGEIVIRIKTNMKDPNPAFRDRVLFRVCERVHPRVGDKYKVWPLLEFSWAVDDYLLGITHVIRGKELMIETDMENYIWGIFGWKGPVTIHTGLFQIEGVKLSKSKAKKEVMSGEYTGWDDPRTWSLQSLRRRGIKPEAIRKFILDLGLNQNEITVPIDLLYSINRKIIDKDSDRYYFIPDPVEIEITKAPELKEVEVSIHPDKKEKRIMKVKNKIYISKDDFEKNNKKEVRLLHLFNIKLNGGKAEFTSLENKDIQKLTWACSTVKAKVLMPDGSWIEGFADDNIKNLKSGEEIQFERFGFVRFDGIKDNVHEFWFTHK